MIGIPAITQTFNQAIGEYGNDFATAVGKPIYSPVAGVFGAEQSGKQAWGNRGIVYASSGLSFAAGHLTSFAKAPGDKVKVGDLIGYTGGAPSDPNSGNTTGPHVELQFFQGPLHSAASYLDPQNVPGFAQLEQIIFGGAPAGAAAPTLNTVGSGTATASLNPLDSLSAALNGFTGWIGRTLWLVVGLGLVVFGLLFLVFEDLETAGKSLGQAAISNPEMLAA